MSSHTHTIISAFPSLFAESKLPTIKNAQEFNMFSDHAESGCIFDSGFEFLAQFIFGGVLGNEQLVEAGVRAGQPIVVFAVHNHVEFHTFEAFDGRTIGASRKLKQLATLFVVPFFKHDLPKPGHVLVSRDVSISIDGRITQFFEVKSSLSANQGFNFFVIEERFEHGEVHKAFKALFKGAKLVFALLFKLPLNEKFHKLLDILLSDINVVASFFEFNLIDSAK